MTALGLALALTGSMPAAARADAPPAASLPAPPPSPPPPGDARTKFLDLGIGPTVNVSSGTPGVALEIDLGFAITPDRKGYLFFAPQFSLLPHEDSIPGEGIVGYYEMLAAFALGFEYDVAVRRVPGLAIAPRLSVGYAGHFATGDVSVVNSLGVVEPSLQIKYVLRDRYVFAVEPLSVPLYFGYDSDNAEPVFAAHYRFLAFAGFTL